MGQQKSAEAIVGLLPQTEGLNTMSRLETELSMTTGTAELAVETQALTTQGSEQYSREQVDEAVNVTVGTGHVHEESLVITKSSNVYREPPWYGTVCPVV